MANDLVVQLGAKLDQFSKDMDQAGNLADDAVDRIESSFANLNPSMGGFASLGVAAAGVTGLVGSLLASLVKVNSELAELQKNAEYTGQTAERFQSIQFAAGQGGVSSDQSATDLRNVARLLADAKENENSLTKLLDANNIKYKDRNGQVITLNQLLGIAGGLINKFDSIPEKVKAAQMLGLSEGWVESLRNGSKAFEDIAAGADKAGVIIDNATVAKAAEFDRAWKQSSAQLGAQFKSVAADIGGWLDGLIDKAEDLLTKTLAAQGVTPGGGQETFNAIADAADVVRKDVQGLAQDYDQVNKVLEKYKASATGGDIEIVSALELIRAKAQLTAQMLAEVNKQNQALAFPGGVPLPSSRPAAANNPSADAAHLPKRKDGEEAASAYDRAIESLEKHTARTEADTKAVGLGSGSLAELRAEAQLTAAALQAGLDPASTKVANKIQDLAQDAGDAAEALAKARVASDTEFSRKSAFLSPEDLSIAQQLKGIYGNDIPAALASTEAAGLRAANTLKQISSLGQDVNRSFLVDFGQQIRNGASAMDALRTAGLNALGKISDKLLSMAADNLWASAFGGSTGGVGSFFTNLFGGSGGGGAAAASAGAPLNILPPMYASGTDSAVGGLSLVGENGPELMNVPRGAQIIPNDVLRGGMGGGVNAPVNVSIDARGADSAGLARVQAQIAKLQAELPMTIVATVQGARKRNVRV